MPLILPAWRHEQTQMDIKQHHQISGRVTIILAKLAATQEGDRAVIVTLKAQGQATNKLISIAEIVKRERLASTSATYQYTALSTELIEIARRPSTTKPDLDAQDAGETDDSEAAFETQRMEESTGTVKRAVPVMTIYLSDKPIKELRLEYG